MKQYQNIIINIVFAVLAVIFVNLIFYFGFLRFDFTSNKIYSLSKSSKKLLKNLDDYILIRAIFSKELPEQYKFIRLYVEDMLKEYKAYSRGKVKFEFIDPMEPKSKIKPQEAYSMGIAPIRFTTLARDKYEMKEGFMGIAMLYRDNKEVIPVVNNIETLEYDITSAIKRLTTKTKKVVGLLTGHGENTLISEETQQIRTQLEKLYEIKSINIKEQDVLSSVDGLIIIGPKENFEDKELFYLDQYILSGKPVAFLLNKYEINTRYFYARKINSNIFNFLSNYGINIKDGLIVDPQCQKIALRMQQGFFVIENILDYPFMPIITKLNKEHPIVKDLGQVVLPFVSPIEIKVDTKDVNYSILLETSKSSFLKKDVYTISPIASDFRPDKDSLRGPFIVAAEFRGKFKTYFNKEQLDKLKLSTTTKILTETDTKVKESRIIVVASDEFVDKEVALLANIIDFVAQDYELLTIRSKKVLLKPLRQIPAGIKIVYRYFITLSLPCLIILAGLYRWYYRKNKVLVI